MSCFAMACHQHVPCKSMRTCQRVWHYCEPPYNRAGRILWICQTCKAIWRYDDADWWRDPIGARHAVT